MCVCMCIRELELYAGHANLIEIQVSLTHYLHGDKEKA